MHKLSVIIPVYNVERYLVQCLESIIHQTYENLEIICVDDGSTDGSVAICEKYMALDMRIKVIKQANAGQSVARNAGVGLATGDYVHFMDSDDYVSLNFYEKMLEAAIATDADIATGGVVSQNGMQFEISYDAELLLASIEEKFKITNGLSLCVVWRHVFKREFLLKNNFQFHGRMYEDVPFILDVMLAANYVVTVPNVSYYYVYNANSLLNKHDSARDQQWLYAQKHRASFIKKHGLSHIVPLKESNVYIYKFLFLKVLTKSIDGNTVRWRFFGLQILKKYKKASEERIFLLE